MLKWLSGPEEDPRPNAPRWSEEKRREFERRSAPLMEWLRMNANPHAKIIIDQTSAELVSGEMAFIIK